jgi:outer membrane protein
VATYRTVLDAHTPAVLPALAPDEPLSLPRALLLANRYNEQLAIHGETYLQSLIARNRAFAAFLPTISVNPGYSLANNTTPTRGPLAGDASTGGSTSHSLGASASGQINLFNGFADVAAMRQADAAINQQRALLLDQQSLLLVNVASAYYQILHAEQSATVLTHSLTVQRESLRYQEARLRQGSARPLDVAQTRSQEAATRVSLRQAQSDARNGRTLLGYLIGLSAAVDGPLSDELGVPENLPAIDAAKQQALSDREDLAAAASAVQAAQQAIQIAFARYFPSVSFDASHLLYRDPPVGSLWSAGLSANVPIFTAGLVHADVRDAWSRYRQAVLTQSQLRRQVFQDVQTAYENLTTSQGKVRDLQDEVTAAQQAYDLADRSYQLGSASNLDRLTAQDSLLAAQLQLTNEQLNYKVFYLDLLRVVGQLQPGRAPADVLPVTLPRVPTTMPTTAPATMAAAF